MSFTWEEVWQCSAKEVQCIGDAIKKQKKVLCRHQLVIDYWPDHLGEVQHLSLSPLAFPRDEEAILVNLDNDYHDKVQLVKYGC